MALFSIVAASLLLAPRSVEVILVEQDTTKGATDSAREATTKLLQLAGYRATWDDSFLLEWNRKNPKSKFKASYTNDEVFPTIPDAWDLLQIGKQVNAERVCFVRIKYNAESIWVSLGPKTKGTASVDLTFIDVRQGTLLLRQRNLMADSTRVEKGWETAASLVVSAGFTAVSGGPKTPHLSKAVHLALAKAFEPLINEDVSLIQR